MLKQLSYLQCPQCKIGNLEYLEDKYVCGQCLAEYSFLGPNSINLLHSDDLTKIKKSIQEFWGDTCKQWYSPFDDNLDQEKLLTNLNYLEDMFLKRRHLATTEMKLGQIGNKRVLEVGSGGGGHSALFRNYGAHVTAVDITPERVASTGDRKSVV